MIDDDNLWLEKHLLFLLPFLVILFLSELHVSNCLDHNARRVKIDSKHCIMLVIHNHGDFIVNYPQKWSRHDI